MPIYLIKWTVFRLPFLKFPWGMHGRLKNQHKLKKAEIGKTILYLVNTLTIIIMMTDVGVRMFIYDSQ